MKKIFFTAITAIVIVFVIAGCKSLIPAEKNDQSVNDQSAVYQSDDLQRAVLQSSEEKTPRTPVSPITDGGGFNGGNYN